MLGQVLNNRYRLDALVGRGAMGEVYRAFDCQTGATVAVKILARTLSFDAEMITRFRREGDALRQLRHRNIVGLVDFFQFEGQHVLVMEFVPGDSLEALIRRDPLPIDRALQVALDLGDALICAHRLNIVHRDLKPANVLLAGDGTPKLTDFGVARLISAGTKLTGTGTQVGTPYYMSPEAWEGRPLNAQADIWSLGIVLYEMLTGQVPFGGDTLVAVMNKVLTAPLPDLKALRPDTPPALARIVRKMLTRDPARRYQTMRQVTVDLEAVATAPAAETRGTKAEPSAAQAAPRETKLVQEKVAPPTEARPGARRLTPWLALGAGVLAVVCLLGGGVAGAALVTSWRVRQTLVPVAFQPSASSTATFARLATTAPVALDSPTPTETPPPTPTSTLTSTGTDTPTDTATSSPLPTLTWTPTRTRRPPTATWIPSRVPSLPPTAVQPPPTTPPPTSVPTRQDSISGRVTWRGQPMANLAVELVSGQCSPSQIIQHTRTDSQGRYNFLGVSAGTYAIGINGYGEPGTTLTPYEVGCTASQNKSAAALVWWPITLWKTDLKITFPAEGGLAGTNPTFTWEAYPDATRYEVTLQDSAYQIIISWAPAAGTSFTPPAPLVAGGRYYLLVDASDSTGELAEGHVTFYVQ
jgi:serine/threonine protein kinase